VINDLENADILSAVQQSVAVIERLNKIIKDLQPAARFGMAVMDNGKNYSMSEAAKNLYGEVKKSTGADIGQNKLIDALRILGFLDSRASHKNEPYQQWVNQGLFVTVIKETPVGMKTIPQITGKGLSYILPKLLEYYK